MADLNRIVDINTFKGTASANQAGFGIGMALGVHKVFTEPFVVVNSTAEVEELGFSTTSSQYKIASLYFGQEVSPNTLYIGRYESTDVTTITCQAAPAASTNYTITLTDSIGVVESFTYSSAGVETNAAVATGLAALINAGTVAITADASAADGTFTLVTDLAATEYSVVINTHSWLAASNVLSGTRTTSLNNLKELSREWYVPMDESHLEADILEVAAWTEANTKLYGFSTASAVDKTTALTGVGAKLKDLGYDRTFSLYKDEAGEAATVAESYAEAAWIGKQLPKAPGSSTWALTGLSGVDTLNDLGYPEITTTESTNLLAKNMNTYEDYNGLGATYNGTVASGEYIDIIRGIDWFEARLQERLFNLKYNADKVPYTNAGVALEEAQIRAQCDEGITVGLINGEIGYEVTTIDVADVSPASKASRAYTGYKVTFTLAGAIHYSQVNITVSV